MSDPHIVKDEVPEEEPDSEEEEDAEDDEPILKYTRFEGQKLAQILTEDSVSAFAICPKLIVVGSHNGIIYVLDLKGMEIKRYRAHQAAVAAVSIDKNGTTIASAGIDGRAVIFNLAKTETSMYDFKRPLRAVAIDPDFSRNGKGRLVSGGLAGQLILSEKGWMGNKETILGTNEGPILQIAWHENLLAWSNDRGVRVYDLANMRMVGLVERRPDSPRADIFKCRLLWKQAHVLIVGWFDHIYQVEIQEGVGQVLNLSTTYIMKLDCVVSGLATLADNLLIVAYTGDLQELANSPMRPTDAERPEIRIINNKFEEISEDALGMRGFALLQPNDYAIYAHPTENSFFIVSPKDVVSARERDLVDHVQWLVENEKYDEALVVAKENTGLPLQYSYHELGRKYIDFLQEKGDFRKAAEIAPEVYLEDAEAWEKLVFAFAEKGHLADISPHMPIEHPRLSPVVYEMALAQYMKNDPSMLLSTIQKWPVDCYDTSDIIEALQHKAARTKDNTIFKECIANLLVRTDSPHLALPYYLELGKPETPKLILDYLLFDYVQDSVIQLVTLDVKPTNAKSTVLDLANQDAINLLVEHNHSVPTSKVVDQLQERPALLYCYFRALIERDAKAVSSYSDLQMDLYAEYDREKLLLLLQTTNSYSLEKAAALCERRDYIPELVYIYGKTGNNKKALNLIIERLGDVQQAIAYATSQADPELWEDLITYSLDKPAFIRGLLEQPGLTIEPAALIRRLRPGLVIEGLKETLSKIFSDLDLQMSLSQCGSNIHRSEIANLSNRLRAGQRRGLLIRPIDLPSQDSDVFVFLDGKTVQTSGDQSVPEGSGRSKRQNATRGTLQRRTQRQTTAAKITKCAIERTRLLEVKAS